MASTTSLSDAEYSRQAAELASFRRMLVASRGTFSLSFAVCTNRTLRDSLIDQLCAEFPAIELIALPGDTTDVYETVRARIETRSASEEPDSSKPSLADASGSYEPPAAIFITDLEPLLPAEAEDQPVLTALNLSRESWEEFECPIVFWLAEYAAALVTAKAADLWRYRSHHFEFVSAAATPTEGVRETFGGFDMLAGLPYEQKRFRMAELEQRIEDAGPEPSSELRPHVVTWSYELAKLYEMFGKFDQSEEFKRHVLALQEKTHGPDSPEVATAVHNLAQLLKGTNRLAEAEPLMRRALAIDTQSYGAEHPNVATDLNNLAQLLQATNRLAEAEPLMRRALGIDTQSYGADHPEVARDLNNLAKLLKATNRLAEAEPLCRRALAIGEQSYGAEHPTIAIDLNNLAQLLEATNRLAEAEPLMRRALAIDEQSYGAEHPDVAIDLNNLAQLLQDTNRLAEAEPLLRRALEIDEQAFGAEHPKVATDLNNLAMLLQRTDRPAEAEPLIRRALDIRRKFGETTGYEHPDLQATIANYRELLEAMGLSEPEIAKRLAEVTE